MNASNRTMRRVLWVAIACVSVVIVLHLFDYALNPGFVRAELIIGNLLVLWVACNLLWREIRRRRSSSD